MNAEEAREISSKIRNSLINGIYKRILNGITEHARDGYFSYTVTFNTYINSLNIRHALEEKLRSLGYKLELIGEYDINISWELEE